MNKSHVSPNRDARSASKVCVLVDSTLGVCIRGGIASPTQATRRELEEIDCVTVTPQVQGGSNLLSASVTAMGRSQSTIITKIKIRTGEDVHRERGWDDCMSRTD